MSQRSRPARIRLRLFSDPEFSDSDVAAVAALHSELLAHSPLVLMGADFVERFYYRTLIRDRLIGGALVTADDRPAAFIVATDDPDGFMPRAFRRHPVRCGSVILWSVLKEPSRLLAMREAMSIQSNMAAQDYAPGTGEILSFGVRSEFRSRKFVNETGRRFGPELMSAALDFLRERHTKRVRAVVDKDNLEARLFYKSLGWRPGGDVHGWSVPTSEFLLDLTPEEE